MTTENVELVQEPSLEDVYKEAGITEAQPQPQVVVATPAEKPTPADIPDAYDDGHKAFLQGLVEKQSALEANQQEFRQERAQREQATAQAKLEEDIREATDFVKENAGLNDLPYDDKTKTALANFELNERARTDVKFKALWDARNNSPTAKAALTKAMGIISKEISKKFEVKVDPQAAASRKALKAAQQSSATTETEGSDDDPMGGLVGAEFERAWANMVRTNN